MISSQQPQKECRDGRGGKNGVVVHRIGTPDELANLRPSLELACRWSHCQFALVPEHRKHRCNPSPKIPKIPELHEPGLIDHQNEGFSFTG